MAEPLNDYAIKQGLKSLESLSRQPYLSSEEMGAQAKRILKDSKDTPPKKG